jgi:hypothetical protein
MLRFLGTLTVCIFAIYLAYTVPLGKRTFAEHVRRIWATQEAQELREDLKVQGGRAAERLKDQLVEEARRVRAADGGTPAVPGARSASDVPAPSVPSPSPAARP